MTGSVVSVKKTEMFTRREVQDPVQVAHSFGLREAVRLDDVGRLPFILHNFLRGAGKVSAESFHLSRFFVDGDSFFWMEPTVEQDSWQAVGLRGHKLVEDTATRKTGLVDALRVVSSHPGAMSLVKTFITTFGYVERVDDGSGERQLTSCSLPDFPLIAFISDFAGRHIPPLTVATASSSRLMAENIYHEAVHQYVNHRLLTEDLFVSEYDSRTSPRVPISWRADSVKRNQSWELDRVLHAATVYVQLLEWRRDELLVGGLSVPEREAIVSASRDAISCSTFLIGALADHLRFFTSEGALFIGRLSQAAEYRSKDLQGLARGDGIER